MIEHLSARSAHATSVSMRATLNPKGGKARILACKPRLTDARTHSQLTLVWSALRDTVDVSVIIPPPAADATGAPQFQVCAAADPASQPQSWTGVAAAVDNAGKVDVTTTTSSRYAIIFLCDDAIQAVRACRSTAHGKRRAEKELKKKKGEWSEVQSSRISVRTLRERK